MLCIPCKLFVLQISSVYKIIIVLVNFILIVYFEVYGCQMNVNDTEVAWSILKDAGYKKTTDVREVLENSNYSMYTIKTLYY